MRNLVDFLKREFSTDGFKGWIVVYAVASVGMIADSNFLLCVFAFLTMLDIALRLLSRSGFRARAERYHMHAGFDFVFGLGLIIAFYLNDNFVLSLICILATIVDLIDRSE